MTEFDVAAVDLSGILNKTAEDKAKQLPDPKTFHLLCVVPEAMEEFADSEVGLIKSSQVMHYEEVLTPVLFVVKLGPDCYKDMHGTIRLKCCRSINCFFCDNL